MKRHLEAHYIEASLREKRAYRSNAREWTRSLSSFDIADCLDRRRHCFPKYAIKELIREEQRRRK